MSELRDIGFYHAAVHDLPQILGEQSLFSEEFEKQYIVTMHVAKTEFGPGMGRGKGYSELGPKGESEFQKLKQWVIDNYPWPVKKT